MSTRLALKVGFNFSPQVDYPVRERNLRLTVTFTLSLLVRK